MGEPRTQRARIPLRCGCAVHHPISQRCAGDSLHALSAGGLKDATPSVVLRETLRRQQQQQPSPQQLQQQPSTAPAPSKPPSDFTAWFSDYQPAAPSSSSSSASQAPAAPVAAIPSTSGAAQPGSAATAAAGLRHMSSGAASDWPDPALRLRPAAGVGAGWPRGGGGVALLGLLMQRWRQPAWLLFG